jgi:DNA polymerase III epsilon subunit-like protein
MRVLIFDTETTGLPETKIISPDTLNKWPHIVQFSYIIFDTELNDIIKSEDYIVQLVGINIPEKSTEIHGITNKIALEEGKNIEIILNKFFRDLKSVDLLVGHNISFDINMIMIELLRIIYNSQYTREHINDFKNYLHFLVNYKNIYCTLQESIHLCAIKATDKFGREYMKYPKLLELHQKIFRNENEQPKHLHNSFNDILVTLRCFMFLKFKTDLLVTCENFNKTTKLLEIY